MHVFLSGSTLLASCQTITGRSEDMPGKGIRVQADEGAGGRAAPLLRVQPAGRGGQRQLQGHHYAPH